MYKVKPGFLDHKEELARRRRSMEIVTYERANRQKLWNMFDKKQTMSAHKRTPKYKELQLLCNLKVFKEIKSLRMAIKGI